MTEIEASGSKDVLCRDCLREWHDLPDPVAKRCPECGSPRIVAHEELSLLSIAHIDCDAFYAAVEKRDNPELRDKPVIIGGGQRGVVSTACYVARMYGVRSAMPMFKALASCPHAVVIRPNMEKYAAVGKEIREMMLSITPSVEPISIDEAFLDLTGTEKLHHGSPARTLAKFVAEMERKVGISASIGLSYNKFLAKVASDLDKPRGFAVIGRNEALSFLAPRSVTTIWGVGKSLEKKLEQDGITLISQLQNMERNDLVRRYGAMGDRLYFFSRGQDDRRISSVSETKSISAETTFEEDIDDPATLDKILWKLCEKVSGRLKSKGFAARTVTLKLKTKDFRSLTRSRTLPDPTQLAETLYRAGRDLLAGVVDGKTKYRLLGIGGSELTDPADADPLDLADPDAGKRARIEKAMDKVRAKLGQNAVTKGRSLK